MPTPKFRHPHRRRVGIPKFHRQRYSALAYFAGITNQGDYDWNKLQLAEVLKSHAQKAKACGL